MDNIVDPKPEMARTDLADPCRAAKLLAGVMMTAPRWVLGWMFFSAFWRRVILEHAKHDPHRPRQASRSGGYDPLGSDYRTTQRHP